MPNKIVIDFETFYDSKTFSLKKQSTLSYVRDERFKVHGFGYSWVHADGYAAAPKWVSGVQAVEWLSDVDWANTAVIAHNAKFDGLILSELYKVNPAQWLDTKGMSRAVFGKGIKNHSLATLAEHFGLVSKGVMKTDGVRDLTPDQERELAKYCLHDVELGAAVYLELEKKFPRSQYKALDWTVRTFVTPRLELDVQTLEQLAEDERARKAKIFDEIGIPKSVFSSNVKFPKLLEERGYTVPMKTSARTGKEIPALGVSDPDFLDMMESENEELRTLCEARVAAKSTLLETRSEKLANIGRTGTWSFDVEFSGANQTHRYSGGSGAGGNPQNFTACRDKKAHEEGHKCPGRLRKSVKAPQGFSLVVGDFSNIELRLVAYLSKDPGLVEAIERDIDLYCDFASTFYGRKITKKDELERKFGKCAILGLGYGMGAKKFKRTARLQTGQDISEADAERAVEIYRGRYTRVPQLWYVLNSAIPLLTSDETHSLPGIPVKFRKETLVLPSGLEMHYPNLRQENDAEGRPQWVYDAWGKTKSKPDKMKLYGGKVLENISQGLAGELCRAAIDEFGDMATGQVHDEIHLLVRQPLAKIMRARLEHIMSRSPAWLPNMKLKAEVGIGPNWLEAK